MPARPDACVVCRRSLHKEIEKLDRVCDDCVRSLELAGEGVTPPQERALLDVVRRAAARAWEFADAMLDVQPKARAPRLGDPGPSRWKPRMRR